MFPFKTKRFCSIPKHQTRPLLYLQQLALLLKERFETKTQAADLVSTHVEDVEFPDPSAAVDILHRPDERVDEVVRRLDARVDGVVREALDGEVGGRVCRVGQEELGGALGVRGGVLALARQHRIDGRVTVTGHVKLWDDL